MNHLINNDLNCKLKNFFGYDSFRPGQLEIIQHLLNGEDVLAVMPTGAGKSLCFQLPALIQNFKTIIISPLVALMNDQTAALRDLGVEVELIHSGRDYEENAQSWRNFATGDVKILYMSPERLMQTRMLAALDSLDIGMFVVDEAHCISKWGAGFRPDYEALSRLRVLFPKTILAAFTATADQATRVDINQKLSGGSARQILKGFGRDNLSLAIYPKKELKKNLIEYLNQKVHQSGIVYCLSRNETDEIAEYLNKEGFNAISYHAGKTTEYRNSAQDRFMTEDGLIMVATIAFGMGIDKSDIRFVIHASLPGSIEAYYQEIGRAGRDGKPADTVLFFGLSDLIKRQRMIFEGEGADQFKVLEYKRLEALTGYCETVKCRKVVLLSYFDEESVPCGNCDNCVTPPIVEDHTTQAIIILSAIKQTGEFFGTSHIIDLVRGSETAKIKEKGHSSLESFGKGARYSKSFFQGLIRQLISSGILRVNLERFGAVQLMQNADKIVEGREQFFARAHVERSSTKTISPNTGRVIEEGPEAILFQSLKALRLEIARVKGVPAYVVFSDRTLQDMSVKKPKTKSDFLLVTGVGNKKMSEYYDSFSELLKLF
ncbi:DNA helicase RecQ [Paracoccaceae bacterium]|nr:DNA helicase RecQ [Paracoccaceae bacterium]|tara:strand:- start:10686 stop:12491 length:1806 start_codon:yes stop_codon:yes gene_type:complete